MVSLLMIGCTLGDQGSQLSQKIKSVAYINDRNTGLATQVNIPFDISSYKYLNIESNQWSEEEYEYKSGYQFDCKIWNQLAATQWTKVDLTMD